MTFTQGIRAEEHFGASENLGSLSADTDIRWDTKFYKASASSAGLAFVLPDPRTLGRRAGSAFTFWLTGANGMDIEDNTNGNVGSIAIDEVRDVYCVDDTTQAGSWFLGPARSVSAAAGITPNRAPWWVNLATSSASGFNIRSWLDTHGYGGSSTVAVTLRITGSMVLGSSIFDVAALDSGDLPAGSTILLVIDPGCTVTGKGGDGGNGGNAGTFGDPPSNGENGGPGIYIRGNVTLYIVNYGTIQGGGGGGGGGGSGFNVAEDGGGGGGGAGFRGGDGGYGPGGASDGSTGRLLVAGAGGSPGIVGSSNNGSGGAGGAPAVAGTIGVTGSNYVGGTAGAAGALGWRNAGTPAYVDIVAGTQTGSVVVV